VLCRKSEQLMLQAVIFDFDGVITDSEMLHLRAFNEALREEGVHISTKDYYRDYLGLTDLDLLRLLVEKELLRADEAKITSLAERKKRVFEHLARTEGSIFEGVRDFLQMLADGGIQMAICSGALLAEIEMILEAAELRSFFGVIVSAEQVKKAKPHPEGFLLTLDRLNTTSPCAIEACGCVVIEDSRWGIRAARAAGMHTVAVTNSYDADQLSGADKIVERLNELSLTALQELCV